MIDEERADLPAGVNALQTASRRWRDAARTSRRWAVVAGMFAAVGIGGIILAAHRWSPWWLGSAVQVAGLFGCVWALRRRAPWARRRQEHLEACSDYLGTVMHGHRLDRPGDGPRW